MRSRIKLSFIVALLLCAALGARAGHAQAAAPFDQLFLRSVAQGSAAELAIARLAQARATRPDVKAYAETLVHDHEAYGAALRDLAAKRGVALPSGLSAQGQAAVDRLARVHGSSFDSAFIAEALRLNAADLRAFHAEAARTSDTDIGAFVAGFLPMDEQHEAGARALEAIRVARMDQPRRQRRLAGPMPVIPPPSSSAMPVIRPPQSGSNMPVIPPSADGATPVIPPPRR